MNEWVLIVFLFSPGGDYMDKVPVYVPNQAVCKRTLSELPRCGDDPMGVQYRGICVTRDHWEGKKFMSNVLLEPTFK